MSLRGYSRSNLRYGKHVSLPQMGTERNNSAVDSSGVDLPRYRKRGDNLVADLDRLHALSFLDHLTRELMAHDEARVRLLVTTEHV